MDNLTHSLVGVGLARAGLERRTPLATATLVVAANAPDIDVLSYVGGEYYALSFRRGITHGWPAILILPVVLTGVMLAWDRWIRLPRSPGAAPARAGPLLALSAAGVLTHPTLDWMNTYGMRWGLPFDAGWSYGDSLFIIDPWIWLVLGAALYLSGERTGRQTLVWVVATAAATVMVGYGGGLDILAPWLAGVAAVVLAARRFTGGSVPARAALAVVASYVLLLTVVDRLARAEVREVAVEAGLVVQDVMVAPLPAQPLASSVEVRTDASYVPGRFSWSSTPRARLDLAAAVPHLTVPAGLPPGLAEEILRVARERPDVRHYLTWSRYPYVRVVPDGAGWTVRFLDARYDDRPEVDAAGLSGVTTWVGEDEVR